MCMHVCDVCVCVWILHLCIRAHIHVYMWRSEVDIRCLSPFVKGEFLVEHGVH